MSAKPRLLDMVREALRVRHYSYRTEQQYVGWIRRYIHFHGLRHPRDLGGKAVESFLSHLAVQRQVSSATQAQALAAVLFLYKRVLNVDLPWISNVVRATRPRRLPVVLTREEIRRVISNLDGNCRIVAGLLYGSGLRLMEALQLRVKDVDLNRRLVLVRNGKGAKDRITILPDTLIPELTAQVELVRNAHRMAREQGFGGVELPYALARKYPRAHLELAWQYVFPASKPSRDPRTGAWRRHHLYEDTVQRRVKQALRDAGIDKPRENHADLHARFESRRHRRA